MGLSSCGNFGLAGYNDGYMVKTSMQNGEHVKTFFNTKVHQNKKILGLFCDALNHYLVSCDDCSLAKWDFLSGLYREHLDVETGIAGMFSDPNTNIVAISDLQNSLLVKNFFMIFDRF